ncbi:histidinol dehydrogenase [uncultured Microbacterium sp.]|uniref:histidinol dehydrogenase n=1 Tax=uncultured Microbacterium sp. TaxID=191216 RepID=UPI0025E71CC6|nr:histidinol dehydrogenase [uncultured Microbacterium sp.]
MPSRLLLRVLSWIALFVVGVVFGLATTVAHASSLGAVPWIAKTPVLAATLGSGAVGIVLGVLACGGMLLAVRLLLRDRAGALATGLGMLGGMVVISGTGPGGSVIVPNDVLGVVWSWTVAAMVLLVVAWPDFSRIRRLQQERADGAPSAPGIAGGVADGS